MNNTKTLVQPGLQSRSEAARYLGISPQTLAIWASTRRYALPFVKIGRRAMYRLSDLDNFIAANLVNCEVGS